ncbi:unnamed protein product [Leptidea sinapis]|uniref:Uncharacterized protein n=1 Tax=Leptidea sinapis TaxID=189913 RepID=A0A5E4QGP5_9NEOP|nr:unnamed protein product [Leptidea sinapis]
MCVKDRKEAFYFLQLIKHEFFLNSILLFFIL